jgi:hypothetical protein
MHVVQVVLGRGLHLGSGKVNDPECCLLSLAAIRLLEDVLLGNDVYFNVVEFAPHVLVVVFNERVVVPRLRASVVDTDRVNVVCACFLFQWSEGFRDIFLDKVYLCVNVFDLVLCFNQNLLKQFVHYLGFLLRYQRMRVRQVCACLS